MTGPTHPSKVTSLYISQDIDTKLNFTRCELPSFRATNLYAVHTLYVYKNNIFVGITSSHSQSKPAIGRIPLTESGGLVSCGSPLNLNGECMNYHGSKNGCGITASNPASIQGIDIFYALPSGSSYNSTGVDIMLIGGNNGLV